MQTAKHIDRVKGKTLVEHHHSAEVWFTSICAADLGFSITENKK
jgi:hypothetical protein